VGASSGYAALATAKSRVHLLGYFAIVIAGFVKLVAARDKSKPSKIARAESPTFSNRSPPTENHRSREGLGNPLNAASISSERK